jgi:hypothetical protein
MAIFAIDYDKTYSEYKEEINFFIEALKNKNHTVILVTARNENKDPIKDDLSAFDQVYYTSGKAKASVVRADVWLDDCVVTVCCDFVQGEASAKPGSVLHQGYKDTHSIWNFEEGEFVNYIANPMYKTKEKI